MMLGTVRISRLSMRNMAFSSEICNDITALMKISHTIDASCKIADIMDCLQTSTDAKELGYIHVLIVEHSLDKIAAVSSLLVQMYGKCGDLEDALALFVRTHERNVRLWNGMINMCSLHYQTELAMQLYEKMHELGIMADTVTFISVISACHTTLAEGRCIHMHMCASKMELGAIAGAALINMYGRFDNIKDAWAIFQKMIERDVVTWNSMIAIYHKHGVSKMAFQMLYQMQIEGILSSKVTLITFLQACTRECMLYEGKKVHVLIVDSKDKSDASLNNALVNMYCKCRSVRDGQKVFDQMTKPDVISWTSMITAYGCTGDNKEAVQLFYQMQKYGLVPDQVTISTILAICAVNQTPLEGQLIHFLILEYGFAVDVVLMTSLFNMYGKCGALEDACEVFMNLDEPDLAAWNAIIALHYQCSRNKESIELFHQMQQRALVIPDTATLTGVLAACASSTALIEGKLLHNLIFDISDEPNCFVVTALIDMYGKCGSLADLRSVFDVSTNRDVASWNALICAYAWNDCEDGAFQLLHKMLVEGVLPDRITFVGLLEVCLGVASFADVVRTHIYIQNYNLSADTLLMNVLVHLYGTLSRVDDAKTVLLGIPFRDLVTWNTMMAVYLNLGYDDEIFYLLQDVYRDGLLPDETTFCLVVSACVQLREVKRLHACILARGFQLDMKVATALVKAYGTCNIVSDAIQIFDEMLERDSVSWNIVIKAVAKHGLLGEALQRVIEMQRHGLQPDGATFVGILDACINYNFLDDTELIHACVLDRGFEEDLSLCNALISAYGRTGSVENAHGLFERMKKRDIVSWNAMIAVYSQWELSDEALCLFYQMQECSYINYATFSSILTTCASKAVVAEGRKLHSLLVLYGLECDVILGTGLVHMYGKCGSLDDAQKIFIELPERDAMLSTAMMTAYAEHGQGMKSLWVYRIMQQEGFALDRFVLLSILSACIHTGLVNEAIACLVSSTTYSGYLPTADHYGCMIDLLGRVGRLEDAELLVKEAPVLPTSQLCMALLAACRHHIDLQRGKTAAKHVFELEGNRSSSYVALMNIFAAWSANVGAENLNY